MGQSGLSAFLLAHRVSPCNRGQGALRLPGTITLRICLQTSSTMPCLGFCAHLLSLCHCVCECEASNWLYSVQQWASCRPPADCSAGTYTRLGSALGQEVRLGFGFQGVHGWGAFSAVTWLSESTAAEVAAICPAAPAFPSRQNLCFVL